MVTAWHITMIGKTVTSEYCLSSRCRKDVNMCPHPLPLGVRRSPSEGLRSRSAGVYSIVFIAVPVGSTSSNIDTSMYLLSVHTCGDTRGRPCDDHNCFPSYGSSTRTYLCPVLALSVHMAPLQHKDYVSLNDATPPQGSEGSGCQSIRHQGSKAPRVALVLIP